MLSSFPLSLALILSVSHSVIAVPGSVEEWGQWAKAHREKLSAKYGDTSDHEKRSSGTNIITNQNADSSFFGSLAIGTPPVSYNVILDTGSADLWVADNNCNETCSGVATFDPSDSSTYSSSNADFSISYGSGQASGTLGTDVVQMAGFSVANQTFAVCDTVSDGLLTPPVSGLLGLAFKTIASSGATPFWQALVAGGAWDSPVMAFQLTRFLDDQSAKPLEYGGSFTMALTTQGTSVPVPTGAAAYAAIDTGTTLVGGPSQYMSAFYSQIPGAQPGTGNFNGYYTYPCATTVNVTMAFGGRNWPISEQDFRLTQLTQTQCLGAFFDLQTGRSAPSWIVGDTFLKNVYSVFRYNPPSVGFAQLSSVALAYNGANTPVPSATIGSTAATVSATATGSSGSNRTNTGSSTTQAALLLPPALVAVVVAVVAGCIL
ncbi:hypothetical protein DXG03_005241 [Asterophora parasitica]|uniref:Peptidase A1 domain-containing protein n=1 Tax=Asterophora parasitica TaxID=117018 RepID=A0A9P7G5Z1_9AGAR|nr:hypothetical protein DXG03_005241 [Asterophora parasitica]